MIRRLLTLATGALVALTGLGGAFAQGDSLLQRFDLAIENLEIATASVPSDGVQARDELERALNALLTLSRDATSSNLVHAMERTFERTRVAVENQSHTDMAVQTAVLAGGFSRLVMDSAYAAASSGDLELARTRLLHLAEHLAFSTEASAALEAAGNASELRLAFEAGAADAIAADLAVAQGLAGTDKDAAYANLAKAYGESLLVQDSPRAEASLNRDLVNAANALVLDDPEALTQATRSATAALGRLASAARSMNEDTVPPTGAPAPEALPEVATPSAPATEPAAPQPAAEASTQATPTPEAPSGAPAGGVAPASAPSATPAPETRPVEGGALVQEDQLEAAVAARLAELAEEEHASRVRALAQRLVVAGLPRGVADATAERLVAGGHETLDAVLEGLDAAGAEVVANVRRGDQVGARAAVERLTASYGWTVAPVLAQLDPAQGRRTSELLAGLAQQSRLSSADATLVLAQLAQVRGAFSGGAPTLSDELEGAVGAYWSGTTRSVVFVILGILAIFPLTLLNLAFGGGNRNWRLVSWALFLLLVPVFYEAVAGLLDLVGGYVDLSWVPDLGQWSMFGSLIGQAVWALLVLLALLLAIAGLRGICVQFGLLGSGSRKARGAQPAPAATPTKSGSGHTTIDWEEEF